MPNYNRLNVSDKLLLAAYDLEQSSQRPFSAEDLVVAAWKRFPDAFGLAGYGSLHPDSNRVFAEIMGSKPIRKQGLLIKVGKKMYQLTDAGREHARLLLDRVGVVSAIEKADLFREVKQELKRLFSSKAAEKFRNGRLAELTFHDACSFWGISPRSSAIELEGRINKFNRNLDSARKAVREKTVSFEHGGQVFSETDLDNLLEIHHELLKRFQTEIEIISERRDERKI
ncbi:MAG: hypothetical protein JRJ29_11660 [Deltaproteobacteria bacterium]|nr:hypothetical protein [Deltaproteobacteria bacterium]